MQKLKNKLGLALLGLSLTGHVLHAQVVVQNTGIMYVTGATDIVWLNGSLNNASTAALTNNGQLYLQQQLTNDQPSMNAGTGTLYFNGSSSQALAGSQTFKTYNFVSNNAAGITLNNSLSVAGLHTFSAGVITSSATPDYLIYESGASYTGDNDARHVKGWVRKNGNTNFVFPVGNGTFERTVAISGLSSASTFNAFYAGPTTNAGNVAPPLVTVDPNEYWIVNRVSGSSAVVTLNWDNSKIPMPNYLLANIRAANYLGGFWTQAGSGATGNTMTTGSVATTSTNAFGSFVIGSISWVLALNFLDLSAHIIDGKGVIEWKVSNDNEAGSYEVQRSNDGTNFYAVGLIPAAGLSTAQYKFQDNEDLGNIAYYRIVATSKAGAKTNSKTVKLSNSSTGGRFMVSNPAHGTIYINSLNAAGVYNYRLSTVIGQVMQQGKLTLNGQQSSIILSSSISKGILVLQLEKPGSVFTTEVLVR